MPWLL